MGGHQRYQVLKDFGAEYVDVVVVDLDPTKEKALNIALNKITGSWDTAKLTELIGELDLEGYDRDRTGFTGDELSAMLAQTRISPERLHPGLHPPGPGAGPQPDHAHHPP